MEVRYRITCMIEVPDNPHINSTAKTDSPNLTRRVRYQTKPRRRQRSLRKEIAVSESGENDVVHSCLLFLQSHCDGHCELTVPDPARGDDMHEAFGATVDDMSGRVT